jgi:hypothetical protein
VNFNYGGDGASGNGVGFLKQWMHKTGEVPEFCF